MTFSEDQTQLPSLWRIKFHATFWTVGFGAILFLIFFAIMPPIEGNFAGLITPTEVRMSLVWCCTILGALIVNKMFYRLNPQLFRSNTHEIRQIREETKQIPQIRRELKEISDFLVTSIDKVAEAE